jgi:hypothetical protein
MTTGEIDRFAEIPDPLRSGPARPPPEPVPPSEPSPTRAERGRRFWIAGVFSVVWVVLFALFLGIRPDLARAEVLGQVAAWTLALPLGLFIALRPRATGWPPGITALRIGLVGLVFVFVGLAVMPVEGTEAPLSFKTVRGCLSLAFVFGLLPLLVAAVVLRGAFLNAPALRGALVGAVCGLAGSAGIHSHCVVVSVSHVLLAHGLPIVIFAALGAFFGIRRGRA